MSIVSQVHAISTLSSVTRSISDAIRNAFVLGVRDQVWAGDLGDRSCYKIAPRKRSPFHMSASLVRPGHCNCQGPSSTPSNLVGGPTGGLTGGLPVGLANGLPGG